MSQQSIAVQRGETSVTAALRVVAQLAGGVVMHTTDGNHVAGSYHYIGRAVDIALPSGPSWDSPELGDVAAALLRLVPIQFISEFIWAGPNPVYIKNGRRVGPYAVAAHHNHIHLAATANFTYEPPKETPVSDPSIPVVNAPIVSLLPTPSGQGYWIITSDGGVFSFGDAEFHGSLGGIVLSAPVVLAARTDSGNGYFMVGRDGGIFAFGDAAYKGRVQYNG